MWGHCARSLFSVRDHPEGYFLFEPPSATYLKSGFRPDCYFTCLVLTHSGVSLPGPVLASGVLSGLCRYATALFSVRARPDGRDSFSLHAQRKRIQKETAPKGVPGPGPIPCGARSTGVALNSQCRWHWLKHGIAYPPVGLARLRAPYGMGVPS